MKNAYAPCNLNFLVVAVEIERARSLTKSETQDLEAGASEDERHVGHSVAIGGACWFRELLPGHE